jgi:hypothetical protein
LREEWLGGTKEHLKSKIEKERKLSGQWNFSVY